MNYSCERAWAPTTAPMYQVNTNWGQTAAGYREPRHNNSRYKNNWSRGQQRHQNQQQPATAREAAHPAAWQQQPPAPCPGGFQDMQGPVVVKLQGLPVALCSQKLLEAMLEQAGLCENITRCDVGVNEESGKADIYFSNGSSAQMCVDHFSGCCWDKSGMRVTAQMATEQGQPRQDGCQKSYDGYNRATGYADTRKNHPKPSYGQPSYEQPTYMMALPMPQQPVPVGLPFSTVRKMPYDSFNYLVGCDSTYGTGGSDEGSTVTGSSSGRASWDAACESFVPVDDACDTDDGF